MEAVSLTRKKIFPCRRKYINQTAIFKGNDTMIHIRWGEERVALPKDLLLGADLNFKRTALNKGHLPMRMFVNGADRSLLELDPHHHDF